MKQILPHNLRRSQPCSHLYLRLSALLNCEMITFILLRCSNCGIHCGRTRKLLLAQSGPLSLLAVTYLGPLFLRSHQGWFPRVLPPFKVLAQSSALWILTLILPSGKIKDSIFWKGGWKMLMDPCMCLLPSAHTSSPVLVRDVAIWLDSTCYPFPWSKELWASTRLSGFIFSKSFLHGTLLWVPSWPPICTTQPGEVAKKSELLECSGPRNITLSGSLVLARMSL